MAKANSKLLLPHMVHIRRTHDTSKRILVLGSELWYSVSPNRSGFPDFAVLPFGPFFPDFGPDRDFFQEIGPQYSHSGQW